MKDVMTTAHGTWKEIETAEDAKLATRMGQTAVYIFYNQATKANVQGLRWLVLEDAEGKAIVTMGAWEEGADASQFDGVRATGHATGYRNTRAYPAFAEDIAAVTRELNIVMQGPNHMGMVYEDSPAGMGM